MAQFFLTCLLILLIDWPYFYFQAINLIVCLMFDLAIGNVILMALKIAVDSLK